MRAPAATVVLCPPEAAKPQQSAISTPIVNGIRWTLWMSLLALPFSYAINVLLARISPAALGAYGVLNVYIGIAFVFFFLGGCAVPMKFLPELDAAHRTSFLASYGLVILASFVPWLLLAAWRPQVLHFVFGDAGTPELQLQLVYLSPLYLGYLLMITSLKGILEMKWAQLLDRSINVGLAVILVVLFLGSPAFLRQHVATALWLIYIGLASAVGVAAFCRLAAVGAIAGRPRFWLPPGFWPYTLLLQANGFLGALGSRLDYILIVNTAGVEGLGNYVAITSIPAVIPRIAGFVVDSLLPALTNCLSVGNLQATAKVAEVHLRMIFPAVLGLCLAVSVLVRPILAIMGPHYLHFAGLVQLACIGAAIQSFNGYTSAILTATDRLRYVVVATLCRSVIFAGGLWLLWLQFHLAGAVIAWIAGESAYHAASLVLLHRRSVLHVPMFRTYCGFVSALAIAILPSRQVLEGHYVMAAVFTCLAAGVFLAAAGYRATEVRELFGLMLSKKAISPVSNA